MIHRVFHRAFRIAIVVTIASAPASAFLPPTPVPEVRLTTIRDRGAHVTCWIAYTVDDLDGGFVKFVGGASCLRD